MRGRRRFDVVARTSGTTPPDCTQGDFGGGKSFPGTAFAITDR